MKFVLMFISGLFLSACVSTQSVVNELSSKYVGKNVDSFFIANGAPVQRHQLNSGEILWVWDSGVTSVYIPSQTTITGTNYGGVANYTATTYGGGSMSLRCVVQFMTASDGTIKSIRILRDTIGWWTTSMCHESLAS